jgi:hypothetical protein
VPFAIPAIIAAGGAIGGSLLSSHARKSAEARARNSPEAQAQSQLLQQQAGYGREAGDVAGRLLPTYEQGVNYLGDYWKNILGPDNHAALQAIAPLVRARESQTAGLLKSADFLPRGGASSDTYTKLYDDQSSDILDLLGNERTNARSNYGQLIGDVGARSAGLLSSASGSASSAASGYGSLLGTISGAGERAAAGTASSIGDFGRALGPLLIELMRRSRGSGSSGSGNDSWG